MADFERPVSKEAERRKNPIYVYFPIRTDSLIAIDMRPSFESDPRPEYIVKRDILSEKQEAMLIGEYFRTKRVDETLVAGVLKKGIVSRMNVYRPEFPNRASLEFSFWNGLTWEFFRTDEWRRFWKSTKGMIDVSRIQLMAFDLAEQDKKLSLPKGPS